MTFKKVMTRIYRLPALLLFTIAVISCNNNGKEVTTNEDTVVVKDTPVVSNPTPSVQDTAVIGCYNQITGRDTVLLQLQAKGANVTGSLVYDFFEKDRNDGTVQADVRNGVVNGWYLFRSEGIMSVRQVSWKIDQGKLLPGTGEMIQRNDSLVFKNADKLNYDAAHPFVKIPCTM